MRAGEQCTPARLCAGAALLAVVAATSPSAAAPSVWIIDDGEKIRRDATSTPFERGELNPVWHPGAPVRVFALRGETIALQVVVEADDTPLSGVTVDVRGLPAGDAPRPAVSRFVEHFVTVRRPSGGRTAGESLGWEAGAGPARDAWVGDVPDALIPVEVAPAWAAYPLRIAARTNGIVWVDVDVPRDQPAGTVRGSIDVAENGRSLASLPLELDVEPLALPASKAVATVFYDPAELTRRIGPDAEAPLWRTLRAHGVAPLHDATSPEDVARQKDALVRGDGVLALGAYGGLGAPSAAALARVEAIADAAASAGLLAGTDVFVYADDERCASPWGAGWRSLLRSSRDPNVRGVRVAWTCSDDPAEQPVDIPILLARYDDARARVARARGKEVWVYNGVQPRTGTFLLDAEAVAPRVNGWIAAMHGIPRWFYWESTYWYGRHGAEPIDPFSEPETLRNEDGDWANGDGVLLYPGRQKDLFREHSLGLDGVVPSIRLKNWRRGLEDAGYLELARTRDRAAADAVARALVPTALDEAHNGRPAWPLRGEAFFAARRSLLAIATGKPGAAPAPPANRVPRGVGVGAILVTIGLWGAYLARPLRRGITRIPSVSSQARSSIPHRAAEYALHWTSSRSSRR